MNFSAENKHSLLRYLRSTEAKSGNPNLLPLQCFMVLSVLGIRDSDRNLNSINNLHFWLGLGQFLCDIRALHKLSSFLYIQQGDIVAFCLGPLHTRLLYLLHMGFRLKSTDENLKMQVIRNWLHACARLCSNKLLGLQNVPFHRVHTSCWGLLVFMPSCVCKSSKQGVELVVLKVAYHLPAYWHADCDASLAQHSLINDEL